MIDNPWQDISSIPKNSSVVIVKANRGDTFECQYAPIPENIGWYGFMRLPEFVEVSQSDLKYWKRKK